MTLASGIRLGSYEVVAQIGAGGMGEVYRGRDTWLSIHKRPNRDLTNRHMNKHINREKEIGKQIGEMILGERT